MTRTLETVPTIAVFPEENLTLSEKVEKWVWQLCRALEADYDRRYPNSSQPVRFSVELGNITNLDLFLDCNDDFINNNPDNDMKNKLVYFVLNSIENYFYLF